MIIRKFYVALLLIFCTFAFAQEKESSLDNFLKFEAFIDKIMVGYETPISNKFLLDLGVGVGATNVIGDGDNSYRLGEGYFGQFAKAQIRYYFNRTQRKQKGHSLVNNAGSFFAFQSKFNLNGNKDYIGKVWMNDFTFGQQFPFGEKFIFKYNAGLGYGYNLDFKDGNIYPAVNISFGYVF